MLTKVHDTDQDAVQHFGSNPSLELFTDDLAKMIDGRYSHPSIVQVRQIEFSPQIARCVARSCHTKCIFCRVGVFVLHVAQW